MLYLLIAVVFPVFKVANQFLLTLYRQLPLRSKLLEAKVLLQEHVEDFGRTVVFLSGKGVARKIMKRNWEVDELVEQFTLLAKERFRQLKIAPPTQARVDRLVRSAIRTYEEHFCTSTLDVVPSLPSLCPNGFDFSLFVPASERPFVNPKDFGRFSWGDIFDNSGILNSRIIVPLCPAMSYYLRIKFRLLYDNGYLQGVAYQCGCFQHQSYYTLFSLL